MDDLYSQSGLKAANFDITDGTNTANFGLSDLNVFNFSDSGNRFEVYLSKSEPNERGHAKIGFSDNPPYGSPSIEYGNSFFTYDEDTTPIFMGLFGPVDEGSIVQGSSIPTIPCFTLGTLISTPTGSTPVQDLVIGDLILNHLGQSVPVKWIGRQRFHPAFIKDGLPVCIRQGALGHGLPLRDLYVSPGHAFYIDDCLLIDAKAMINGTTISQVTQWEGDVEYFHIETEHHEIILAEGAPTETFMDNISRTCFNNYSEYQELYPEEHEMIELDIPRVSHQRQLPNAIKHRLEAISQVLIGEVKGQMVV
jgi:hypothetical protein